MESLAVKGNDMLCLGLVIVDEDKEIGRGQGMRFLRPIM